MKRVVFIIGFAIVIVAVFMFVKKLYLPPLPIESLSAKEVIEKLEKSGHKIVELAEEGDYIWYATRSENKGISIVDENIKQMIVSNGWKFKQKDGSDLFFEKDEEKLIATTQMWSEKYVFVKVQSKFKKL